MAIGFVYADSKTFDSVPKPARTAPSKSAQLFQKTSLERVKGNADLSLKSRGIELAQNEVSAAKRALETPLDPVGHTIDGVLKKAYLEIEKAFFNPSHSPLNMCTMLYIFELGAHCKKIIALLKTSSQADHKRLQRIREAIDHALNSDAYLSKKPNEHLQGFRRFLQCISYQLNTQADGTSVYRQVGEKAIQTYAAKETTLSGKIDAVFSQMPADKQGVLWGLKHILEVLVAFIDNHFRFGHLFYNSYAQGNYNASFGDILINEKRIHLFHGASPMNDSLFEAQLKWEEHLGIHHVQHTLEFKEELGEKNRLEGMRDLTATHKNYDLMGTLLNGDPWEAKGDFKSISSVAEFHSDIEKLITSDFPESMETYTGYALPLLTKTDIQAAIDASKMSFEALLKGVRFPLNKEENKRLSRAMVLGLNGFLVIQSLLKLEQKLNNGAAKDLHAPDAMMGQLCKQGVDRGPMTNAVMIAYTRWIENGGLDAEDEELLVGMLLTRAMTVDARLMVDSRRTAVQDLFKLVERDQTGFIHGLHALVEKKADECTPIQFSVFQEEHPAER